MTASHWGRLIAFVLKQPVLAEACGFIGETTVPLPDPGILRERRLALHRPARHQRLRRRPGRFHVALRGAHSSVERGPSSLRRRAVPGGWRRSPRRCRIAKPSATAPVSPAWCTARRRTIAVMPSASPGMTSRWRSGSIARSTRHTTRPWARRGIAWMCAIRAIPHGIRSSKSPAWATSCSAPTTSVRSPVIPS